MGRLAVKVTLTVCHSIGVSVHLTGTAHNDQPPMATGIVLGSGHRQTQFGCFLVRSEVALAHWLFSPSHTFHG